MHHGNLTALPVAENDGKTVCRKHGEDHASLGCPCTVSMDDVVRIRQNVHVCHEGTVRLFQPDRFRRQPQLFDQAGTIDDDIGGLITDVKTQIQLIEG